MPSSTSATNAALHSLNSTVSVPDLYAITSRSAWANQRGGHVRVDHNYATKRLQAGAGHAIAAKRRSAALTLITIQIGNGDGIEDSMRHQSIAGGILGEIARPIVQKNEIATRGATHQNVNICATARAIGIPEPASALSTKRHPNHPAHASVLRIALHNARGQGAQLLTAITIYVRRSRS